MAETRAVAEKAFDFFLEAYGPKYDKAVACLAKDRDVLLAFYDFPAEHWKHIRTTNPIESTFATVRLRTTKTKGCLSRMTALTMVFKLCQSASKKWRRLDGSHQIADCQRRSKTSPPGRSKTSPLNVMRYAVLGGSCGPTGSTIAPAVKQVFLGISAVFGFG